MLSKFFSHGKGRGRSPVDYVLGQDRQREGATLLRGSPELMIKLIDSRHSQAHKYTSGALSFSDHISDDEIDLAIESYNRFLGADSAVEVSTLWVKHEDKGRTELHFITANVDLLSGRAYTPYVDRLDFKTRDALDDLLNTQIADADPDDPSRKRLSASAADYIKQSQGRKALVEAVDGFVESLAREKVQLGGVFTRKDVSNALTGLGFRITRSSDKTISVSHPEMPRNLKLKGAYYGADIRLSQDYFVENERAGEQYREDAISRAEAAFNELQERLQKRSERVRARYEQSQAECNQLQQGGVGYRPSSEPGLGQSSLDLGSLLVAKPSRSGEEVEREPAAGVADQGVRDESYPTPDDSRRLVSDSPEGEESGLWLHDERATGVQDRVDEDEDGFRM